MATQNNSSLRKLIHTQLYLDDSDDESRSSMEQLALHFNQKDNAAHSKMTKRISSWLAPRKNSSVTARSSMSSINSPRAPSPLVPTSTPRYQQSPRHNHQLGHSSEDSLLMPEHKRRTIDSSTGEFDDFLAALMIRTPRPAPPIPQAVSRFSHRYSSSLGSSYSTDIDSRPSCDMSISSPGPQWSEDVQQLIRETEQAVKATGDENNAFSGSFERPSMAKVPFHENSGNFNFPRRDDGLPTIRYSKSFDLPKIEESPVSTTSATPVFRPSTPSSEPSTPTGSSDWEWKRSSSIYTCESPPPPMPLSQRKDPLPKSRDGLPPRTDSLPESEENDRPTTPKLAVIPQKALNSQSITPPQQINYNESEYRDNCNLKSHSSQNSWPRRTASRFGPSSCPADAPPAQHFRRIQADESLSEEQLVELIRQRNEARRIACHGKVFSESFGVVKAPSPLFKSRASGAKPWPQHSQNVVDSNGGLATIDRMSVASLNMSDMSDSPPTPAIPPRSSRRRTPNNSISILRSSAPQLHGRVQSEESMGRAPDMPSLAPQHLPTPRIASYPNVPPKNPRRLTQVPEQKLPKPPKRSPRRISNGRKRIIKALLPFEDDENLYFSSTPYSLNHPKFRHGRITFAKSERQCGGVTMDDTLDWTAFQMAILGAGEFMMADAFDDERDEVRIEDIQDWFSEFGFESYGELVPEPTASPRSSSGVSMSSSPCSSSLSTVSEEDLPMPASTRVWSGYGSLPFKKKTAMEAWGHNAGPRVVGEDEDDNAAAVVGAAKRAEGSDDDDGAEETVKMGFNLHSDLGDFLKWEADAFGGGFYGAY